MGEDRPGRRAQGGALREPDQRAPGPPRRPDGAEWLNFYGRRRGKALRPHQRSLLDTRLAELAPPPGAIEPATLFPGARALWLEIGFGGGEHLLRVAADNPAVGLIGCEPFMNGVAQFLAALEAAGLSNVRLHADDARFLLTRLPAGALGRVYLLYPDPWPKRRHVARRFVNPGNLDILSRAMAPGAELRLATDVLDYAAHARRVLAARPDFVAARDGADPWPDWPGTRYEAKALREGRAPCYQIWRKV